MNINTRKLHDLGQRLRISAPGKVAEAHFGFDAAHIVAAAKEQIARHGRTA